VKCNWTIIITRRKGYAGKYGNELTENLVKEDPRKDDIPFNITPKSQVVQHARNHSLAKWQIQWDRIKKV